MWNYPAKESLLAKIGKHAKIAGVIFIILGVIGVVFPAFVTLATVAFVSWLMFFAGVLASYFTWVTNRSSWLGWLKSIALIAVALFMIFYPMSGVGTIGLLLSIYFFVDAFAGFGLARAMYPSKGWLVWLVNALLSFALGLFFVIGWPFSSLYLIGIFIGISLLFDGITLFFTGRLFHKIDKGEL